MSTRMKIVVSGLILAALTVLGLVTNLTGANAGPVRPEQHPTPIPGAPSAIGWGPHAQYCWSTDSLSMEADQVGGSKTAGSVGFPKTTGLGGTHLGSAA